MFQQQQTARRTIGGNTKVTLLGSYIDDQTQDHKTTFDRLTKVETALRRIRRRSSFLRVQLTGKEIVDFEPGWGAGRLVKYSWREVNVGSTTPWLEPSDRPSSSGGEPPASPFNNYALNGFELNLRGEKHTGIALQPTFGRGVVVDMRVMTMETGDPVRIFLWPLPEFFAVNVTQESGLPGSLLEPCTFTYSIRDFDDNVLADSDGSFFHMTPEKKRTSIGEYEAGDGVGLARWDWEEGKIKLWDANEVPTVEACPEGAAVEEPPDQRIMQHVHELERQVRLLTSLAEVNR